MLLDDMLAANTNPENDTFHMHPETYLNVAFDLALDEIDIENYKIETWNICPVGKIYLLPSGTITQKEIDELTK